MRCNSNPDECEILKPKRKGFKSSVIAYKMLFDDFPKEKWVTFDVTVQWSKYMAGYNKILSPGKLDVFMSYDGNRKHIVDNETIEIGRNDDYGYYFKFGIYRVGSSNVPVKYNLAGYMEERIK